MYDPRARACGLSLVVLAVGLVAWAASALAQSNVDATYQYVWGENVGWLNLDDTAHHVSVDADTTPIDCDMNHDGLVNGLDVQLFVDFLLLTSTPDWRDVCSGDVEATPDWTIDLDDVASFVACLLNP